MHSCWLDLQNVIGKHQLNHVDQKAEKKSPFETHFYTLNHLLESLKISISYTNLQYYHILQLLPENNKYLIEIFCLSLKLFFIFKTLVLFLQNKPVCQQRISPFATITSRGANDLASNASWTFAIDIYLRKYKKHENSGKIRWFFNETELNLSPFEWRFHDNRMFYRHP